MVSFLADVLFERAANLDDSGSLPLRNLDFSHVNPVSMAYTTLLVMTPGEAQE